MKPKVIGYALDLAANKAGAAQGPLVLKESNYIKPLDLEWINILETSATGRQLAALEPVESLCQQLAKETQQLTQQQQHFLAIGGDHSMAMGTWNGAAAGLKDPIGLIWVDAHMDAHTMEDSESKNIHGMPVATLLGHGEKRLVEIGSKQPAIQPENLALVGIRSFETGEAKLLKELNVKIYFIEEVLERGIENVMEEAINHVLKHAKHLGISIDIDGLDPEDAPAVSTPEKGGIRADEFIQALSLVGNNPNFIGAGIAEFNPTNDQNHKTEKVMAEIIKILFLSQ